MSYDNGASVAYGYTDRGDLTDHDLAFAGAASANYDYAYNGVGQLITRSVSDPAFNWLPLADATDAYAVNGLNQYTSVAGAAPVYDGNGNLTTDHNGRGFTYDAENVLRSASGLASGSAAYRYHADGSRREKTAFGTATQFYYMGGLGYLDEEDTQFAADQEIAEYAGSTLLRRYIRLPGSIDETFLMIDATLDAACTATSYATCERWAQADRIGSVVAAMDSAGAVLEKYRYSPYGVPGWEGAVGFPFRFTGQKLDPETGLYYYKARYYDPETGRFLQTDPIGYEDQMNLYAYVGNDPINLTDPTGMESCGSRLEGVNNCSGFSSINFENRQNLFQAVGEAVLPDGSQREQTRLGETLYKAASRSEGFREAYNSPERNQGKYDTSYDGYDVGAVVRRKRNLFGDDNFESETPNINAPYGLNTGAGLCPSCPVRGAVATVVAPTPHRRPGDRPTNSDYGKYVAANGRRYSRVAERTGAPVVVVTRQRVYIFGVPQ